MFSRPGKKLSNLGGTSLSVAKGVVNDQTTPFATLRDVPPSVASTRLYGAGDTFTPSAILPIRAKTRGSIESDINRTEPSARPKLAQPG